MKRFSTAIIFVAALGLLTKPALADDASQRALASQLIDITGVKDANRAGFESVINSVIENMHQHGMPQAGVDELKAAEAKWYDDNINFEDVRPKMVDTYVAAFSEDDLKQLLAFYQSPVGQKAMKQMPSVAKAAALIEQAYTKDKIASLNAELTPILTKYRDQMEPSGASGAGGAPGDSAPPAPTGN